MNTQLSIVRGDSARYTITVTQGGGAYDLTGARVWFTLKRAYADDDPGVAQKTIGAGIVVASPTTGIAVVSLLPADTAGLSPFESLLFDVQVEDVDGEVFTVAKGRLVIEPDVTRST